MYNYACCSKIDLVSPVSLYLLSSVPASSMGLSEVPGPLCLDVVVCGY